VERLAQMVDLETQLLALVNDWAMARSGPFLIGIAGGVAVGKSTLARSLAAGLNQARPDVPVEVVATDGFLRPNRELEAVGLTLKKGFPETYDQDAFHVFLAELAVGNPAPTPIYSHVSYDILPGETRTVDASGVVIVEGLNVLQTEAARRCFHLTLYVDAEPEHAKAWYLARLHQIIADDPQSFFARLDPAQRDAMFEAAWTHLNLLNLREHIAPTAAFAEVVVRKAADHAIAELVVR